MVIPAPPATGQELQLAVGESGTVSLHPAIRLECAGAITSVSWSVESPSLAFLTPREPAYRGSWVTGSSAGAGIVNARIGFSDGSAQQATPRAMIVAPRASPSGIVAAEGAVLMDAPLPGNRFVPFTLPRDASQVDISVDWASVLNAVDVFLWQGSCSGTTNCGGLQFLPLPSVFGVRPVRKSTPNLSAGEYTLRIDNLGPGAETVRYEVRFTPR